MENVVSDQPPGYPDQPPGYPDQPVGLPDEPPVYPVGPPTDAPGPLGSAGAVPTPLVPSGPTTDAAADGDAPRRSAGMRSWLVAGAVTLVLIVGAVFVLGRSSSGSSSEAAASTGSASSSDGSSSQGQLTFRGRGTSGEITDIGDVSFTVSTTDQSGESSTVTVQVTDTTTYTASVEGSASDLAVGDNVTVIGEEATDGASVAASSIVDSGDIETAFGGQGGPDSQTGAPPDFSAEGMTPPDGATGAPPDFSDEGMTPPDGAAGGPAGGPAMSLRPTAGSITAIDGSTLTVETADGESVTVTLSDDTTVTVAEEISFDDLEQGDQVRVSGETDGDTVTAVRVEIGDAGLSFGPGGGTGPGTGMGPGGQAPRSDSSGSDSSGSGDSGSGDSGTSSGSGTSGSSSYNSGGTTATTV